MKKTAAIDGSGLFDERTLVAFPLEALEMSVCPVGTTPKA